MAAICAGAPAPDVPTTSLKGWVNTFYRHYRGKKLGPYHVRRWKENGHLHKQYIKPADVEKVRAQCQAHRDKTNYQRSLLKEFKTFKGNWNYYFRILKRLEKRDIALEHKTHLLKVHKQGFFVPNRPPLRRRFGFMVPASLNDILSFYTKRFGRATTRQDHL
jgi:hypothetical protein